MINYNSRGCRFTPFSDQTKYALYALNMFIQFFWEMEIDEHFFRLTGFDWVQFWTRSGLNFAKQQSEVKMVFFQNFRPLCSICFSINLYWSCGNVKNSPPQSTNCFLLLFFKSRIYLKTKIIEAQVLLQ